MSDKTAGECNQATCREPATVRLHGPHGVLGMCEECATKYEGLMRFMGASTVRVPTPITAVMSFPAAPLTPLSEKNHE